MIVQRTHAHAAGRGGVAVKGRGVMLVNGNEYKVTFIQNRGTFVTYAMSCYAVKYRYSKRT